MLSINIDSGFTNNDPGRIFLIYRLYDLSGSHAKEWAMLLRKEVFKTESPKQIITEDNYFTYVVLVGIRKGCFTAFA